jgi:PTS system cellobiose-specific IIC component
VRDGVVGALPLVLVGSLFLLIAQPPSRALQEWVAPWSPVLLVPYRMLGGLIALYVTFSCAHSLAKSYQLDPMSSGLVAMASYLLAAYPTPALAAAGVTPTLPTLPLSRLGAGGIFAGLLLAVATVELTRFFVKRNWTIRLPGSAPDIVVRSFVALIPAFAMITLTFLLVHVLGIDLVRLLETLAAPFVHATGRLPAVLAVVGIDSGLWLLGVHASAALATLRPFWETMLLQNMDAAARGESLLPHIASQPFYLWFVWQGGSGATLPLALHLLFARSGQLKGVGRVGILPALFNINEPVLFGAPVVLNPRLALPFFLAPLVSAVTAYAAFSQNLVTRPYLEMPWTLPAPVGAFLSTGGDWRAAALAVFNLGIGILIYWPFFRRYDRELR